MLNIPRFPPLLLLVLVVAFHNFLPKSEACFGGGLGLLGCGGMPWGGGLGCGGLGWGGGGLGCGGGLGLGADWAYGAYGAAPLLGAYAAAPYAGKIIYSIHDVDLPW